MDFFLSKDWQAVLKSELQASYFSALLAKLKAAYKTGVEIYPPAPQVFAAFNLCPFEQVKVVILGQDPYHSKSQAHGLCFSVPDEIKLPPSLKNIYKELVADTGKVPSSSGNLERWAKQGVLLLNATLTVEAGQPGSHQALGWERFTDAVIRKISTKKTKVVFILWGKFAIAKAALIDPEKHLILTAPHPSPFSAHRGFFGSKPFSKTNLYLEAQQKPPIKW